MRILICSNAYPPNFMGGAELVAHEEAQAFVRLGHDVRVFAGEVGSAKTRHDRIDDVYQGIPIHRIATVPEDYSPEYLNFLHPRVDLHFGDVLRDFRPDILHCHNLTGLSVKLPIIARQHGAKVVCTLHDFWGFCLRNTAVRPDGSTCDDSSQCRICLPRLHDGRGLHIPLRFRKDFMRLALDRVNIFIAPSRYVADRYAWAGLPAERIAVVPNGVDIERFRPDPGTSPDGHVSGGSVRVTFVGYFGKHKGVATLLDALALVPERPIMLQLVGEGPERDAYAAQIAALGLESRVRFLGKMPSAAMPSVYARSDIVVLPSVWDENQPVCLMEAMAAGLPIIASRKGGIPDLIAHGENGLMFTAGDPRDLAIQLARLVEDPGMRSRFGKMGRQRIEKLGHDRQAHRILEIYTASLGEVASHPDQPPHEYFAALGSLRRKMTDEGNVLADGKQSRRYFMPPAWVADCLPLSQSPAKSEQGFAGVVVTGWPWRILRLLGIDAIVAFPPRLRRRANALLGPTAPMPCRKK